MRTVHRKTARLRAAPVVMALAFVGCGDQPATGEGARDSVAAAAPRDTATLTADAVSLAGFVMATADSVPWRESWSVPARVVLDPSSTQSLGAIAEGRVARVLARVGDVVSAGHVLVTLHSHEMMDLESDLAKATAGAREAESALSVATSAAARAERLYELRAFALADLERARGELAQAGARQEQARAELRRVGAMRDHLRGQGAVPAGADEHEVLVRAPAAGTVASVDARAGSVVLVGAPLVTVTRATSLLLAVDLPERAVGVAERGALVRFTASAVPGETFEARVVRVAPTLDSLTRTIAVQARVERGAARLRAGMYATAELSGAEGAATLVVPTVAIQAFEGDTVVITARTVGGATTLEAVRVRVGRRSSERAEIVSGLGRGTRVVAAGSAVAKAEILRRRAEE